MQVDKNICLIMDTNELLRQPNWDVCGKCGLNRRKDDNSHLAPNFKIHRKTLEQAISDNKGVMKFLTNFKGSININDGVMGQTLGKIENIKNKLNIRNKYTFSMVHWDKNVNQNDRVDNSSITNLLIEYENSICKLEKSIKTFEYEPSFLNFKAYNLCNDFVRALNGTFFNLGKEEQEFEGFTDESIVRMAFYESLYNKMEIGVVSSDRDVLEILSTVNSVIGSCKEKYLSDCEKLESWKLPKLYTLNQFSLTDRKQLNYQYILNKRIGDNKKFSYLIGDFFESIVPILNAKED